MSEQYQSTHLGASIDQAIDDVYAHHARHSSGGADPITPADIGAVPTTRTVNSKALSSNITLAASDVGAVPTTRTVNSKALSSNITLTASDVAAVPTTRKVNNKALSSDITLSASDVSAVPTTRTVNSKALSSNITLSASDVSAVALSGGKADPGQISSPIVRVTATRALASTDAGKFLYSDVVNSGNITITVPTNASVAFPVGTEIEICRYTAGTVTIAAASGVTLVSANSLKSISVRYATCGLKQILANVWVLSGSLA